jgi:ABC-2 type transport system permease protein
MVPARTRRRRGDGAAVPGVVVIAAKDLRQRLRDRSALMVGVLAPLLVAFLMSVAFRGADTFHYRLALVDADTGPVGAAVLSALQGSELRRIVSVERLPDAAAAVAAVNGRHAQAGLVVPAGLSASVAGAAPLSMRVLTSVNDEIAASVTEAIASSFTAQLNADRLSVATSQAAGAPPGTLAALEARAASLELPLQTVQRPVGAHELKTISYYGPAMGIFFVLFLVAYTARSYFVEQEQGMLERLRAAPLHPLAILAGKSLSVFVFGLLDLLLIAAVTTAAFGASWGPAPLVLLVCACYALAVVALTAFVIVVARTIRQAEGISQALVFGLALLGGNFLFLSASPAIMRRIALFTPNGWALRAFTDLATLGGGFGTVVQPVLGILAFTAVISVAVVVLSPRALRA